MGFSENLKNLLDFKDVQIKELSKQTGISKNTIDNYLSGQKSLPNAENAVKIAKFLGVSVEYLVNGGNTTKTTTRNQQISQITKKLQKFTTQDLNAIETIINSIKEKY